MMNTIVHKGKEMKAMCREMEADLLVLVRKEMLINPNFKAYIDAGTDKFKRGGK
jgi:hypothetical protein